MRTRLAVLTLLATALAAAGCGGNSGNEAKLTASIEAICARHNLVANAKAPALTAESRSELKRVSKIRLAIEQATLAELGKLSVPASMQPAWTQFISYRQALIKALLTLSEHGLITPGGPSLETLVATEEKILAAAKRDRLTNCAAYW